MSTQDLPKHVMSHFKEMFSSISDRDLGKMARLIAKERTSRYLERINERQRAILGFMGLANFMAGVTWALACRASLRHSKEHRGYGKRPASGEMWLPRELLYAVRHQVKDAGWHPITSETAAVVLENLRNRNNRELGIDSALPVTRTSIHEPSLFSADFDPSARLDVARFQVRMVKAEARSRIRDRFDYGGEG